MSKNFHAKWIEDPIYKSHFWFCYGDREDLKNFLLKKKYKKFKVDNIEFLNSSTVDGAYFTIKDDDYVWIQDVDLGVLVHELSHKHGATLVGRGMNFNDQTREAFAYYLEYCFNACLNFIKDSQKKDRVKKRLKNKFKVKKIKK